MTSMTLCSNAATARRTDSGPPRPTWSERLITAPGSHRR
jgi:hypothetical protein